jgi:NADPH:quinone reductase-like Zn-dependent oxidoreductase
VRSYQVLKTGGLLVSTVGILDPGEMAKRRLTGLSFQMKRDPSRLAQLAALVDRGAVKPKVSQILPLADAPRAHDLNEKGQSRGKIVLQVA